MLKRLWCYTPDLLHRVNRVLSLLTTTCCSYYMNRHVAHMRPAAVAAAGCASSRGLQT